MTRIRAGIRLKPEKTEHAIKHLTVRNAPNGTGKILQIHSSGHRNEYVFDDVFEASATQEEVFIHSTRKIIDDAIDGFNGCVFAYGQTGAGKTFTMTGDDVSVKSSSGLCLRTAQYLFNCIRTIKSATIISLRLSVLEIYNEILLDLLRSDGQAAKSGTSKFTSSMAPSVCSSDGKLTVVETAGGVIIPGLHILPIDSEEEALSLLLDAQSNRVVAEHMLNRQSSRSHAIYTFYITRTQSRGSGHAGDQDDGESGSPSHDEEPEVIQSKLHLVDLAGSERNEKTGSVGAIQREANHINKSLSFLEQVVVALTKKGSRDHIPYRQSKLTFILKDSLGGNSNTYLIACVWPHFSHTLETLSTLRFAARMLCVENAPVRNCLVPGTNIGGRRDPNITRLMQQMEALKRELVMRDVIAGKSSSSVNANVNGGGGGGAWMPILTAPQRRQAVRDACIFALPTPTGASTGTSGISVSEDASSNIPSVLDVLGSSSPCADNKGPPLNVHSLSYYSALADTLRSAVWEACCGDEAKVQSCLKTVAEKAGVQLLPLSSCSSSHTNSPGRTSEYANSGSGGLSPHKKYASGSALRYTRIASGEKKRSEETAVSASAASAALNVVGNATDDSRSATISAQNSMPSLSEEILVPSLSNAMLHVYDMEKQEKVGGVGGERTRTMTFDEFKVFPEGKDLHDAYNDAKHNLKDNKDRINDMVMRVNSLKILIDSDSAALRGIKLKMKHANLMTSPEKNEQQECVREGANLPLPPGLSGQLSPRTGGGEDPTPGESDPAGPGLPGRAAADEENLSAQRIDIQNKIDREKAEYRDLFSKMVEFKSLQASLYQRKQQALNDLIRCFESFSQKAGSMSTIPTTTTPAADI